MTATQTTSFKTRDSAVRALKGHGVPKGDRSQYIEKHDGKFSIAKYFSAPHPNGAGNPATGEGATVTAIHAGKALKAAKAETQAKVKATKEPRITVAGAVRELIKAGKTNAEIWEVLQDKFKLTDDKRHYPSWYRSELKRKG